MVHSELTGPSEFISLVAGRWTLALLAELNGGGRRYQELRASLEGISYKVLTDTLRRAERDGQPAPPRFRTGRDGNPLSAHRSRPFPDE